MFKKIRYPLREDEFICLERVCQEWLENSYGVTTGEWWYSTFQKEILIEEPVGIEDNPISWHFYTFNGFVGHIMAHRKSADDYIGEFTSFDGNFDILADVKMRRSITDIRLTQDTKEQLMRYASLIGGQFSFVRVDFLVDDDQKIYLGELTFCPGNAANGFFSDELQIHLGRLWSHPRC
jgi:TupA-like ATPgrasp